MDCRLQVFQDLVSHLPSSPMLQALGQLAEKYGHLEKEASLGSVVACCTQQENRGGASCKAEGSGVSPNNRNPKHIANL